MRVFNYSNGKKGELLGEVKRTFNNNGNIIGSDEKAIVVRSVGGMELNATPYYENSKCEFSAVKWLEEFGVDAVCYCMGNYNNGNGYDEWVWACTGTQDWILEQVEGGNADSQLWSEVQAS